MKSTIEELITSKIPSNILLGRSICTAVFRDTIKNICEDLNGTFEEFENGLSATVMLNNQYINFNSQCRSTSYYIDEKFYPFEDEDFLATLILSKKRVHLYPIDLIGMADYDCSKLKDLIITIIKKHMLR